jgi:hypothetical protein
LGVVCATGKYLRLECAHLRGHGSCLGLHIHSTAIEQKGSRPEKSYERNKRDSDYQSGPAVVVMMVMMTARSPHIDIAICPAPIRCEGGHVREVWRLFNVWSFDDP